MDPQPDRAPTRPATPESPAPRPRLAAVAARAGVSVSTASLAFSGAGPISPATREKVLAAAAELGYAGPSALGRQLRSGRSGIVGVIVGDHVSRSLRDPLAVRVLEGLVSGLGAEGLGVLLVPGTGPEPDPLLTSAAMDAVVQVWGPVTPDDTTQEAVLARGLPLVVGEGQAPPGVPVVSIDDRAGTADLVRVLVAGSHLRVAVVALPFGLDERAGLADADRARAAHKLPTRHRLDGVADAGIEPVAVWESAASLVEEGRAAGLALLAGPPGERPTAVVAQSDLLAAGVLLAAQDLGLRVPDDVSVAGFDGASLPWLGAAQLTTVAQPAEEKGAALARAAVARAAGEDVADVVLPVELVLGTTTGPAPAA